MKHSLLPLLFLVSSNLACGQATQADPSLELLEKVRQTLLTQAMDEGVSVRSHGYIDSSGRLVESAYFQTGTQARGVRIASYVDEMTGPVVNDPSVLPAMLRPDRECSLQYANSIVVNPVGISGMLPAGIRDRQALAQSIQSGLMSSLQDAQYWVPIAVTPAAQQLTNYERFMTGIKSPRADFELDAQLNVVAAPVSLNSKDVLHMAQRGLLRLQKASASLNLQDTAGKPVRYEPFMIMLEMTVTDRNAGKQLLQTRRSYRIPGQPASLQHPPGLGEFPSQVLADLGEMANLVDSLSDCSVTGLHLSDDAFDSQRFRHLDRGRVHGIKPGVQLLMSSQDLSNTPDVFASDWLADLAIGEVVEVDETSARVRVVAGNVEPGLLQYAIPF